MKTRLVIAIALVGALVIAGLLVQRALQPTAEPVVPRPSVPPPPASDPAARPLQQVVVHSVQGQVLRRSGQGEWQPVQAGDILALDDEVKTEADSNARLALGDNVDVAVANNTQFSVAEVSQTLSRLKLADGRLSADVHGGEAHRVRVEVRNTDAVVEARDGAFSVMKRGSAPVVVAATKGKVELTAANESVEITAGQQSLVATGKAPSAPTKIPPTLFVKLGRVPPPPADAAQIEVAGETIPGAIVSINGVAALADASGQFRQTVAVRTGRNEIVVSVEDAVGRRTSEALPVQVRKSRVRASVEW